MTSPGEGLGGAKLFTKPLPASARNWPKHEGLGSFFGPKTEKSLKNDLVAVQSQLSLFAATVLDEALRQKDSAD
jgi:hypothetical protein